MKNGTHYEDGEDFDAEFPAEAYTVKHYRGIAWRAYGYEVEPNEDTEWSGLEERTGRVVCVMIGDDHRFSFDPLDLTPLGELDYCAVCGQIGCSHDGRDRSDGEER